jgi:hypothetical protein
LNLSPPTRAKQGISAIRQNLPKKQPKALRNLDPDNISTTSLPPTKSFEWSEDNERIMVEWCDVAQCYKWLHTRAHARFSYMHALFTIPAIIFSTISGTASFAQTSLPPTYQEYAPMVIGAINIGIGILSTIQQYLKISELNEAHRVSSIAWDKYARNIRIELAKNPLERMDAEHFIKLCRQEYDRLMETSPIMIHEKIIKEFETKFGGKEGSTARENFNKLKKPDICSMIVSAEDTRFHRSVDASTTTMEPMDDIPNSVDTVKDEIIQAQQRKLAEHDNEMRARQQEEIARLKRQFDEMNRTRKMEKQKEEEYHVHSMKIYEYIRSFKEIYERMPQAHEIKDTMVTIVDNEALVRFLDTYTEAEEV